MKRLILLGASGSIGKQSIEVIREHQDEIKLVGVSVGNNIDYLKNILNEFKDIKYVYSINPNKELISNYPNIKYFYGDSGLKQMANLDDYDLLENALVGFVGFVPTLEAIRNHKDIALANKETLVGGGDIINAAIKENNVHLYPIDSEHVAIWQCLQGHDASDVKRLIITGSGGSFRDLSRSELNNVTLEQALKHPVWNMGAKITIDSATMMNKGYEIIEAHHLFNIPYEKIDVILHSESSVHSMVEYNDGSIMAQISCPDMKQMIKYALLYPKHLGDKVTNYFDFEKISSLNFKKMDYNRYPLVKLAKQIGEFGGNFGSILIGANDEAVDLFLHKRISFIEIEKYIFETLKAAHFVKEPDVNMILESNKWAKEYVDKLWANS